MCREKGETMRKLTIILLATIVIVAAGCGPGGLVSSNDTVESGVRSSVSESSRGQTSTARGSTSATGATGTTTSRSSSTSGTTGTTSRSTTSGTTGTTSGGFGFSL